jgi:hypothetical protein
MADSYGTVIGWPMRILVHELTVLAKRYRPVILAITSTGPATDLGHENFDCTTAMAETPETEWIGEFMNAVSQKHFQRLTIAGYA